MKTFKELHDAHRDHAAARITGDARGYRVHFSSTCWTGRTLKDEYWLWRNVTDRVYHLRWKLRQLRYKINGILEC